MEVPDNTPYGRPEGQVGPEVVTNWLYNGIESMIDPIGCSRAIECIISLNRCQ